MYVAHEIKSFHPNTFSLFIAMASTTATVEVSDNGELIVTKRPFMSEFIPSLVGSSPTDSPEGRIKDIHPEWKLIAGVMQFFDPIDQKAIAVWDYKHNEPYFFENGFLRVDPRNGEFRFVHDPTFFPYKPKKGKTFFQYLFGCMIFKVRILTNKI